MTPEKNPSNNKLERDPLIIGAVQEIKNLSFEEIDLIEEKIDKKVKDKTFTSEAIENLKEKARRTKEIIYFYTKLIVLSGLLFVSDSSEAIKKEDPRQRLIRAKNELNLSGITGEQKKVYKPIASDLFYRAVLPAAYEADFKIKQIIPNLIDGREMWDVKREDAWRMYLGLPQQNKTFDISDYKPANSKEDKYYYKLSNFWEEYFASRLVFKEGAVKISDYIKKIVNNPKTSDSEMDDIALVMGQYKVGSGSDEKGSYISYYDKWDLALPIEKEGFIGKPFEIYDRIYYDAKTFEPIDFDTKKFKAKFDQLQETKKKAETDLPG
jgi:hypothetical protein